MRKIKITPVLLFVPISIISLILEMHFSRWTIWGIIFIVIFALIMGVLLLIDRCVILWFKLKTVCIVEIVLIILWLIYIMK